jgi:sulfate transport system permease protein
LRRNVLPGLRLSLGVTLLYVGLIVVLPLAALVFKAASLGPEDYWRIVSSSRALASYRVTVLSALGATIFNLFFGFALAWVLTRYRFPGWRLVDAMVDLPFALPTAVAGIALTSLYADNGWLGSLLEPLGIKVAFTPLGVIVAMIFIGLPFVVRTVQPVLAHLEAEQEEAAATLGASAAQTFRRVILPGIAPALITGFALAFARALGEFGSVLLFAGGLPQTMVASVFIRQQIESGNEVGASAVSVVLLLASLALLGCVTLIQRWAGRHERSSVEVGSTIMPGSGGGA